ncbi:hypothetical protein AB0F96_05740 [Streptomyces sp. NPDC023998]|uniref:hypothetical protein n=1 Tax=Streptomyces sp. NPDC023998 TaxID=3154597 RepID=UPI00340D1AC9
MPDDLFGGPPPRSARSTNKRPTRESDIRTVSRRIKDVARFEDIYRLSAVLERPPGPRVGRSPHYPPYVYLLFAACRGIHGSARYSAEDLQDPSVWAKIKKGVAKNLGKDEAQRLPETGPNRNHWQYAQKSLLLPHLEELSQTFADLALTQALRQGLLPPDAPRSWSRPQRHQLIAGDGTVTKSPTLATSPVRVDPETGEIFKRRVDPAAHWQKEGGGDDDDQSEGRFVLGTKFVLFSSRHRGYFRRVFLRYRHVPHDHPGGEAAAALEVACAILDQAEGCLGVLYDGAFRGMHRDVIARRGRILISKQHKGIEQRFIRVLEFPRCRHELWAKDTRVHERVFLDDGTSSLLPVPVRKIEARQSARTHRWYHLLMIPCPYGPHDHREAVAVTTRSGERGDGQSDAEKGFHRAEHLFQIPAKTAVHKSLSGGRQDAESGFSQLDRSLWNRRMIAFGAEAQSLVILGFMLAQNATSAARYAEDPTYSDAEEEESDEEERGPNR